MLSSRNKIIILIVGALIIFALVIATVFNLWPGGPADEEIPAVPVDLSFLEPDNVLPEGKVFDASNKEEFAALSGAAAGEENISALEKEARDLAEFFVERFGTYSSDARGAQIDDLQPFMTLSMQNWSKSLKDYAPAAYIAFTAEAAAVETLSFSASERRAQFAVTSRRSETTAAGTADYQQTATLELRQDASGAWKVNSLVWGDKQ
ncbi:MAG: hypothetical protein AAB880_00435 [Patescibacteria group bacterium]